ncbi:MAG: major capsid protein [Dichotomicrobium sp.]
MAILDVFRNNAFSVSSLTDAVNKRPYVPGRLGELGIFDETDVRSVRVVIERKNGQLTLIPASNRGGPSHQKTTNLRDAIELKTIHLSVEDRINADELQDVRAFGQESQVKTMQEELLKRFDETFSDFDATLEHLRIGAIKGKILDADGTTELVDLFDAFDITEPAAVDFDLDNSSPGEDAVRKKCSEVLRLIEDALGMASYTSVHAFCGSNFFDDLAGHSQVKEAYERWNAGQALRDRVARRDLFYGGIMFEEYRGKVNGVDFIDPNEVRFVPLGVRRLFRTVFSPADFVETVNTRGLPRYAKVAPDEKFQRYLDTHVQSNPLPYCTRPEVLIRGTRT